MHEHRECVPAVPERYPLAFHPGAQSSIKIYFRLNTLRLCKNLMRTVDSRQFAPFDAFPAAQRITYKFYVGRLAVFDENYVSWTEDSV